MSTLLFLIVFSGGILIGAAVALSVFDKYLSARGRRIDFYRWLDSRD